MFYHETLFYLILDYLQIKIFHNIDITTALFYNPDTQNFRNFLSLL